MGVKNKFRQQNRCPLVSWPCVQNKALSSGFTIGHEGQIGGPQGRFAYFDTEAHPDTIVEISDISGAKGAFFEHIRRKAMDWDGTDPIRPVTR